MIWDEFVQAARDINWITYLGTAGSDGRPHVAPVSLGFTAGTIWFASYGSSRKVKNIRQNPNVAFHWPVGSGGPGELFARGTASVHGSEEARRRLWVELEMPYDLSMFFQSSDNPDLVFVETIVSHASLLGPDFKRNIWAPE